MWLMLRSTHESILRSELHAKEEQLIHLRAKVKKWKKRARRQLPPAPITVMQPETLDDKVRKKLDQQQAWEAEGMVQELGQLKRDLNIAEHLAAGGDDVAKYNAQMARQAYDGARQEYVPRLQAMGVETDL
jgi:hypothetical protein